MGMGRGGMKLFLVLLVCDLILIAWIIAKDIHEQHNTNCITVNQNISICTHT